MDIGSNIQFHRKRLGLSQEELGQKLLVSRQTISLWEKGQTMPTIDNLLRLKEIFGITLDCLLSDGAMAEYPETPLETYELSFTKNDIQELRRFTCRPHLHSTIIRSIAVLVLLLFAIYISDGDLSPSWLGLALCVIVGFILRYFKNRKTIITGLKKLAHKSRSFRLFSEYFELSLFRDSELISCSKHYYKDIVKIHHTKQFLILENNDGLNVFRRSDLAENSILHSYVQKNPSKKAPGSNIVLWKTASTILFIASLATIFMGIGTLGILEEINHLFTQNMWVMFLFTPIPVASAIFGFIAKAKGYPYKKNVIAGIIMTAVLCLYGCFTIIFAQFYNDDPIGVERVEYHLDIDIPEYDHIATQNMGRGNEPTDPNYIWYISDVYFDTDNNHALTELIQEDERFLHDMPNELTGLTNVFVSPTGYDYMLIYNVDTRQYNAYPEQSGIFRMITLGFDSENMCLHIAEYNLEYSSS